MFTAGGCDMSPAGGARGDGPLPREGLPYPYLGALPLPLGAPVGPTPSPGRGLQVGALGRKVCSVG